MQRVEDLPPPTDPWMIRLYEEHPDIAYSLDAFCIEVAHANGHDYIRDPEPRYSSMKSYEIVQALSDLHNAPDDEWPAILDRHFLLRPDELRLMCSAVYARAVDEFPGLRNRIHAYSKKHKGEIINDVTGTRKRKSARKDSD